MSLRLISRPVWKQEWRLELAERKLEEDGAMMTVIFAERGGSKQASAAFGLDPIRS